MTYSIVAADTTTREVGGAGTSCLGGEDVYVIYAASPGRGVIHAQAYYSLLARERGLSLLDAGQAPTAVIEQITSSSFDGSAQIRQYGVVDVLGDAAGFTGSGTTAYAADRQGHVGDFAYSVQGNILTSAKVLEQAAQAFEANGCDLPERLMNALEAGANGGEGDSRCTEHGIPSDSAFLQVESPDLPRGGYLTLRVETSGAENPLPLLRAKLNDWRATHPCPTVAKEASVSETAGCSCRAAGANDYGVLLPLLGCGLVVAWRRAARQLRPRLLARKRVRTAIPGAEDADLCAHEVHGGE